MHYVLLGSFASGTPGRGFKIINITVIVAAVAVLLLPLLLYLVQV